MTQTEHPGFTPMTSPHEYKKGHAPLKGAAETGNGSLTTCHRQRKDCPQNRTQSSNLSRPGNDYRLAPSLCFVGFVIVVPCK